MIADTMMNNTLRFLGCFALLLLLACCHPQTDLDKIDALKKQVNNAAQDLNNLNTNTFVRLEKDFVSCDSLLQFLLEEELDTLFPKLQLVEAYIRQFKETRPFMEAEMDSTLVRLDLLRADVATHYLADSLIVAYIDDETQQVEKLSNQVQYFKDRLGKCRNDLDGINKK